MQRNSMFRAKAGKPIRVIAGILGPLCVGLVLWFLVESPDFVLHRKPLVMASIFFYGVVMIVIAVRGRLGPKSWSPDDQ